MRPSRRPAVIRGFAGSSLATFVALAGHVSAGGAMPAPSGILVPWLLSFMACVLLAGRKLSVTRLALSVAVSQILFHALFVLGTIAPSGTAPLGHVHGTVAALPVASATASALLADGTMWFGHVIAALSTIVALHRGERLLLALRDLAMQAVRWARQRLGAALIVLRPRPAIRFAGFTDADRALCERLLSSLRRRGPPLLLTV
ncbi:hypothetical protein [Microbacterium tumbae]